MIPLYNKKCTNLYFEKDNELNEQFNKASIKCKFYGIDMETFAKFKHDYINELYAGSVYWRNERRIFKSL
jgi:hypothetical protein